MNASKLGQSVLTFFKLTETGGRKLTETGGRKLLENA